LPVVGQRGAMLLLLQRESLVYHREIYVARAILKGYLVAINSAKGVCS